MTTEDPQRLRTEIVGREQRELEILARPIPQANVCPGCDQRVGTWEGGAMVVHPTRDDVLWRYYVCAACAKATWDAKGNVRDSRGRRRLKKMTRLTTIAIGLVEAGQAQYQAEHGRIDLQGEPA